MLTAMAKAEMSTRSPNHSPETWVSQSTIAARGAKISQSLTKRNER